MNKKIIAAAIAASFVAAPAIAEPTVYGKIHNSVDFVDGGAAGTQDEVSVEDRDSKLGFKGSEDLGNGLKAVYQMEFAVDTSDLGGFTGGRNTFVGLAGDFGTFVVGQHDTPHKMSTGKLNFFGDQAGDYKGVAGLEDVRAQDAIAYISPNFSGLTVAAAIVPGGDVPATANDNDEIAAGMSIAAMYSNGGLYAALAFEDLEDHAGPAALGLAEEKVRVGLGYTMDNIGLALVYEDRQDIGAVAGADAETIYIAGKYTMGNNVIKAMYANIDNSGGAQDQDSWGIGLDHNFSKRTQAYVQYVNGEATPRQSNIAASAANDVDVFSIGMAHSF